MRTETGQVAESHSRVTSASYPEHLLRRRAAMRGDDGIPAHPLSGKPQREIVPEDPGPEPGIQPIEGPPVAGQQIA